MMSTRNARARASTPSLEGIMNLGAKREAQEHLDGEEGKTKRTPGSASNNMVCYGVWVLTSALTVPDLIRSDIGTRSSDTISAGGKTRAKLLG